MSVAQIQQWSIINWVEENKIHGLASLWESETSPLAQKRHCFLHILKCLQFTFTDIYSIVWFNQLVALKLAKMQSILFSFTGSICSCQASSNSRSPGSWNCPVRSEINSYKTEKHEHFFRDV